VVLVQELSRSQEFYGRCCVTFDLLTSKSNQFSSGSQWRMSDGKTSRGEGGMSQTPFQFQPCRVSAPASYSKHQRWLASRAIQLSSTVAAAAGAVDTDVIQLFPLPPWLPLTKNELMISF